MGTATASSTKSSLVTKAMAVGAPSTAGPAMPSMARLISAPASRIDA